jgi:hypothetical protein
VLQVLAGQTAGMQGMAISGELLYNGHTPGEFQLARTAAYVAQQDAHIPTLTVDETLAFSEVCQVRAVAGGGGGGQGLAQVSGWPAGQLGWRRAGELAAPGACARALGCPAAGQRPGPTHCCRRTLSPRFAPRSGAPSARSSTCPPS